MTHNDTGVSAVLSRMKEIYGVEKDAELSRALDISPQTLSSWRQRSAVPYALCVECAKSRGASLDWLLYGEGRKMRENSDNHDIGDVDSGFQSGSQEDIRTEIFEALQNLSEDDLKDILNEAAHRRRLRALEQRFENLQSQFFDVNKKAI